MRNCRKEEGRRLHPVLSEDRRPCRTGLGVSTVNLYHPLLPLRAFAWFFRGFQRYPRSATRAVKSCARRHILARGGGDSCPFPVHAGDITRVIADLLSLQPPPPSTAAAEGSDAAAASGGSEATESGDARAFRLAALPTWRLLDAPNAFHEAFSCAVLVMEAAQTAGARGQDRMRVRVCIFLFLVGRVYAWRAECVMSAGACSARALSIAVCVKIAVADLVVAVGVFVFWGVGDWYGRALSAGRLTLCFVENHPLLCSSFDMPRRLGPRCTRSSFLLPFCKVGSISILSYLRADRDVLELGSDATPHTPHGISSSFFLIFAGSPFCLFPLPVRRESPRDEKSSACLHSARSQ